MVRGPFGALIVLAAIGAAPLSAAQTGPQGIVSVTTTEVVLGEIGAVEPGSRVYVMHGKVRHSAPERDSSRSSGPPFTWRSWSRCPGSRPS